eukprot:EC690671.1.p2 GENE.EC690671.1~~EC690671.1.p2  ORF type:complete len:61 (+),score=19.81 EC690671.1:118-300(+)
MKRAIEAAISGAQVVGNETAPRSGAFEITVGDEVVYSKLATRSFPSDLDAVLDRIREIVE